MEKASVPHPAKPAYRSAQPDDTRPAINLIKTQAKARCKGYLRPSKMDSSQDNTAALDAIDQKIIDLVKDNARISKDREALEAQLRGLHESDSEKQSKTEQLKHRIAEKKRVASIKQAGVRMLNREKEGLLGKD
ncbi:hypothetical protein Slin14017_G100620 [Septoria linicola]|nr:hypothetical protein Slin14017_G100620 [Septoria linicola]